MKKVIGFKLSGFTAWMRRTCRPLYRYEGGCAEDVLRYPECGLFAPKVKTLEALYVRLERCIEDKKLYLDPYISLSQLARIVGSNRTYVSNILAPKGGYKYYMNEFRLKRIAAILQEPENVEEYCILAEDEEFLPHHKLSSIVLSCGFLDMRTFRRALMASNGKWAKIIRGKIY